MASRGREPHEERRRRGPLGGRRSIMKGNSFGSRNRLGVGDRSYSIFALSALDRFGAERLPYSLKILLENLLRHEDGVSVTGDNIECLAAWDPSIQPHDEIAF